MSRRRTLSAFATLAALGALAFTNLVHAAYEITIAPETVDRAGVVVAFDLPADMARNVGVRERDSIHPVQIDAKRQAIFVVPEIKANETKTFQLEALAALPLSGAIKTDLEKDVVKISVNGASLLDFWAKNEPLPNESVSAKFLRGGHIHPLRTPSGKILTASYPADHRHHHGIWAAWTKTRFQGREPDFWNMGRSEAKVEFAHLDRVWSGPVHGGFVSRQRYIDSGSGTAVVALNETWTVTAYHIPGTAGNVRIFDLVSSQHCATGDTLFLPEYRYGGVGFRGRDDWLGEENFLVLTSEGETDRVKANTSRVRWCHVGGEVDGTFAGVAMLGHPDNFRSPEPIRVHPSEPFLCFAPSQLGDWEIRPGKNHVSRYRYVVMDGKPDRAVVDRFWNGYARPARVTIQRR